MFHCGFCLINSACIQKYYYFCFHQAAKDLNVSNQLKLESSIWCLVQEFLSWSFHSSLGITMVFVCKSYLANLWVLFIVQINATEPPILGMPKSNEIIRKNKVLHIYLLLFFLALSISDTFIDIYVKSIFVINNCKLHGWNS